MSSRKIALGMIAALTLAAATSMAYSHGDVAPQPVDVTGLDPVGADWLTENPYRLKGGEQYELAKQIGSSGYSQNCARCHGLQAVSGGIAPDVRFLEDEQLGDEWFMERVRKGYTLNGAVKMPPFEGVFSQEAMWAIRSYIETLPKE